MTPVQAIKKVREKLVYNNLADKREVQKPKFHLSHLVRTADIKNVFSKGDKTSYSYILYKKTEVIHETIPSYGINYLPESYNEILLLPTKLSLEENNKVMREVNLFQ